MIYGNSATTWFKQKHLMPNEWGLPEGELARLMASNIKITLFYSPASVLSVEKPLNPCQLVICDASLLDEGILDKREFIALILHEAGHVLNKPESLQAYVPGNDEYYADDYARLCGFETESISALTKFVTIYPRSFGAQLTKDRIARIQRKEDRLLSTSLRAG